MNRYRKLPPLNLTAAFALSTAALTVATLAAGCQDTTPDPRLGRNSGATTFVSADAPAGAATANNDDQLAGGFEPAAENAGADSDAPNRTVEEGDIYRAMAGGLVANLNGYRGLQILDLNNPAAPAILGSLQISGSPVELYLVDDTAVVLMNNWFGYYGEPYAASLQQHEGGVVAVIDLANPTAPALLHQAPVPGAIQTSRLTRAGSQVALYVATGGYNDWDNNGSWESQTVVKSFDLSGGLTEKTQLSLGGYVGDIQATPNALLVASYDWEGGSNQSLITVVDISDPTGVMVQGDTITAAGQVSSQFNLDLTGNILRVVSGSWWGGGSTNHLQTYDATDLHNLTPIDHDTFGAGENLYATLFLGEKAFFVTFRQVDPFHAFHIDAGGNATEMSEFVVSGWNDFFKPALDGTRLLGVGVDNAQMWNVAVSLYDITNLQNPQPLVARVDVDASSSWSEANWDHRAFTVLDGVTQTTSPNGTPETGLVLLPFSGWDNISQTYRSSVQVFSFSATTLTPRGLMEHGSHVRRSFLAESDTTANLSEEALSLYDTTNLDQPTELGRVELAPNYTDYITFGSHAARYVDNSESWWWSWNDPNAPPATVEIVATSDEPNVAEKLAAFAVPSGSKLYKVGSHLAAVSTRYTNVNVWPYDVETTIDVWSLSNPLQPQKVGSMVTDRLQANQGGYGWYGGYGGFEGDCMDCGMGYYGGYTYTNTTAALDAGLAFLQVEPQQQLLGQEESCYTYPVYSYGCAWESNTSCTYYTGSINCTNSNGGSACYGEIYTCTYSDGETTCTEVDPNSIETQQYCYTYDKYRYWQSYRLEVLDLSNPSAPKLTAPHALASTDEGVGMLAKGNDVWLSYKVPVDVANDSRPYVAYYAKRYDLTAPSQPDVGPAVNVPGELFEVDGTKLYTRDFLWGTNVVETSVARLHLNGGLAYLEGTHAFTNQLVDKVAADGQGQLLVSHRTHWSLNTQGDYYQKLSVLGGSTLDVLAEVTVASWAQLQSAQAGRGLFQVPGGFLVFNLADPAQPFPQAFFPARGWPQRIGAEGSSMIAPAGRYGIYRFSLNEFNLLPPAL